jgi:hypothetical protein
MADKAPASASNTPTPGALPECGPNPPPRIDLYSRKPLVEKPPYSFDAQQWREHTRNDRDTIRKERWDTQADGHPPVDSRQSDQDNVNARLRDFIYRQKLFKDVLPEVPTSGPVITEAEKVLKALRAEGRVLSGGPNGTSMDYRVPTNPGTTPDTGTPDEGVIRRRAATPDESCVLPEDKPMSMLTGQPIRLGVGSAPATTVRRPSRDAGGIG